MTDAENAFECKAVDVGRDLYRIALRRSRFADPVFDASPLAGVEYGPFAAYLMRRFGFPNVPCADASCLVGTWRLSTPSRSAFVDVTPSLLAGSAFFAVLVDRRAADDGSGHEPALVDEARTAYAAALRDLSRPVGRHGGAIGPFGPVHAGDSGRGGLDPHPSTGVGVPVGLAEGDGWRALVHYLTEVGRGDVVAGRGAVVQGERERILRDVLDAPDGALAVAAGAVLGRDAWFRDRVVAARPGLRDRALAVAAFLSPEGAAAADVGQEIADEEAGSADALLRRLGVDARIAARLAEGRCWAGIVAATTRLKEEAAVADAPRERSDPMADEAEAVATVPSDVAPSGFLASLFRRGRTVSP